MAIGSGLSAQVGIGEEVTWNTPVSVTRFLEFNNEKIQDSVKQLMSFGMGRGRYQRSDRVRSYFTGAAGAIEFDLQTLGFGMIFKHLLGSYTNAAGTGDTEKVGTIVPDAVALKGLGLTVQVGRPSVDGTVRAFTYAGGKITACELACDLDGIAKLTTEFDFASVATDTSLASSSFASAAEPLVFVDGSITLDSVAQFGKKVSVKWQNGLATDRRGLGNTKREQIGNAEFGVTGSFDGEFEDLGRYNAWVNGDIEGTLVLQFEAPTVLGTSPTWQPKVVVTIPALMYTGDAPQVGGPDIIAQAAPFKALYNGTDPITTVEIHSTESAA